MRTSRNPGGVVSAHQWSGMARDTSGIALMYVLMITGLIGVVTIAVLMVISADLSAGIRQSQAVRVFNVAEAGMHYGLAKLQASGASTYSGETVSITDGSTAVGTAAVTVDCVDGLSIPCMGPYVAFRRVVSVGTLPASGPQRTLVAVIQGFPEGIVNTVCSFNTILFSQNVQVYGNIAANGSISLLGPAGSESRVRSDPPPPLTNFGYYAGNATSQGAITCSQGCAAQVQGTTTPNAPGPVCAPPALPPFAPGAVDQAVSTAGWTMNSGTGYDWRDITTASAGTSSGCTGATPFADLRIQTGAAGTTTVVNIRRLTMGRCGRLIVLGDGNVDLRVGEATALAILMGQYSRFGVLSTDSLATPAPVPAGRLRVSVLSSANPAVHADRASIIAGNFILPNGGYEQDRLVGEVASVYGSVQANTVDIDRDAVLTYDPTVGTYTSFTTLRSWKDQ